MRRRRKRIVKIKKRADKPIEIGRSEFWLTLESRIGRPRCGNGPLKEAAKTRRLGEVHILGVKDRARTSDYQVTFTPLTARGRVIFEGHFHAEIFRHDESDWIWSLAEKALRALRKHRKNGPDLIYTLDRRPSRRRKGRGRAAARRMS